MGRAHREVGPGVVRLVRGVNPPHPCTPTGGAFRFGNCLQGGMMNCRNRQPEFDYSVGCSLSGASNVRTDMACVTEKSPVVTQPGLRLEFPSARDADGTVYHCTVAQRKAERAFNRAMAGSEGILRNALSG